MKEITPKEAFEKSKNNILFVDVRETTEVSEITYDVPNYINLPLSEFQSRYTEIPKNVEVILVCRSGKRSENATLFLLNNEYTLVQNMQGGILQWQSELLPTK